MFDKPTLLPKEKNAAAFRRIFLVFFQGKQYVKRTALS